MQTVDGATAREREIFRTTLDLVAEQGYDRLTMDAIASTCRAGKATLYRRWPCKAGLVVAALDDLHGGMAVPTVDTGSVRDDLLSGVGTCMGLDDPWFVSVFTGLLSALRGDPELKDAFITGFVAPRQREMELVFLRARERGELPPSADVALLATVLPAVVLFHADFRPGTQANQNFLAHVVDTVVLPMVGHARSS